MNQSMMSYVCAMCGDSAGSEAPHGGFKVPPRCVELMKHAHEIDVDAIASPVRVDLCEEDAAIAKRMINKFDTSPIPECDATAVRFDTREDLEAVVAMSGADEADGMTPKDLEGRMIADALSVTKAVDDGEDEYLLDSEVFEAKVIAKSMRELGVID